MTTKAANPDAALMKLHQEWGARAEEYLAQARRLEERAIALVRSRGDDDDRLLLPELWQMTVALVQSADEDRVLALEAQQVADQLQKLLPTISVQPGATPAMKFLNTPVPPAPSFKRKRYGDVNDEY
jgi:hypothetical protein